MGYPEAYCLKCHGHTDTENRHTVILSNNSRALTGKCPKCQKQVYKFMPKKTGNTRVTLPIERGIEKTSPAKATATVQALSQRVARIPKSRRRLEESSQYQEPNKAIFGITMMGACPSCHMERPGFFNKESRNPGGQVVLTGSCKVCSSVMRKDLKDMPPGLQVRTARIRRGDSLDNSPLHKVIHRSFPLIPASAAIGMLFLCVYYYTQSLL
jgi:hypothetical protein